LDLILDKNHYLYTNSRFSEKEWQYIMWKVVAHSREWKREHTGQKYYPLAHCPLLQEIGQ